MDVMTIVTERILSDLERGEIPWMRPWTTVNGAYNRVTGKEYSLLNKMLLRHTGEYATRKQWLNAGGRILEGAQYELVVFWKWPSAVSDESMVLEETDRADNRADLDDCYNSLGHNHNNKRYPVLKYFRVIHSSYIEGVKPVKKEITELSSAKPIECAETLLHEYLKREGIRLECNLSSEAYYSPLRDVIHLPMLSQFRDVESFYSVAYHEAIHSTGAESRLARRSLQNVAFGSSSYSKEELIAEIGSECLMHHLGICTGEIERNSSAYVQGWLRALRNDKRMVIFAAAQAEKAVNYILGR